LPRVEFLEDLGLPPVYAQRRRNPGVERIVDVEGVYRTHLAEKHIAVLLTRPDTNLFGFATN